MDWDEAALWKTYIVSTDIEHIFSSLKSELGLRPINHHIQKRLNGHLFITLLVYHLVQTIRCQLKGRGFMTVGRALRHAG